MTNFKSTIPGFKNQNGQEVISRTGLRSETFPGQMIYHIRCEECGHNYGSNGCDIRLRRCPGHDGGAKGERLLTERSPNLFSC
jgi:hypothetical protein